MLLRRLPVNFFFSRRFLSTKNPNDFTSSIAELNKELEDIFGEPPPSGPIGSSDSSFITQESQFSSPEMSEKGCKLTHIGKQGEAQMVDVSPKENTKRTAIASCKVLLGKNVFDMVSANNLAKGDVLSVAKIAGITGAKHTSNLIPLCHNISLSHVHVDLALNNRDYSVDILGEASTSGKTGVEMEALTAVSIAGLTVYDMCKAASKDIEITNVKLERKTGGKSGDWSREG
ncbi:cyclic pyranopterin monophosphate synthase, mitochondrial [Beta vulgaris subsp. vulgaris]|uniref:cyclic pyranopterin monophosphate synthase, mitochondrial n=1 Tax=Beta vulgaris subsp. vulgaris TaxID=3555 RepID=UPI0020368112|nr:cyclic pyranopterin monophosphate synthase, mitochondrial [Beta vulgaris subsp. vulgaris]XP_010665672.2 cyclic pyranopterin monophosphate synthase, mitochondrial [Beta vulgaris subsp. vulgaris]